MSTVRRIAIADLPGNDVARRFEGADHGASVSIFIVAFPPGAGARLHRHAYDETFVVEEGRVTFTVDDEDVEVEGGALVVVPAGAAHKLVNSGEGTLRLVSIQPSHRLVQEWLEE